MNRLWVRLSIMIAGVLLLVFFAQMLQILLEQGGAIPRPAPDTTPDEIKRRFWLFALFALSVGAVGGLLIGRVISAPITRLTKAARHLGTGALDARVPVGGSQELRELAEAFNTMADALQRAEELRTSMMADVSHELRTPLAVLEANLRAALDGVVALDAAEVTSLYEQSRHISRIVNDLRELALADSSQLPMERMPTDMHALVGEIIQALEPLAVEKDVTLAHTIPALPELDVDPFRIRQVFINLLSNALRHTPPGGSITISGELRAGVAVFAVADDGEGLDPAQLASVFERFYRADRSRTRATGGSGLGLAIVKAIVEAHGGQVAAHSAGSGQGSVFTVRLPC